MRVAPGRLIPITLETLIMDRGKRLLIWLAVSAFLLGTAYTLLCVYIAFQENPNFRYYDDIQHVTQWQNVLPLFSFTLVAVTACVAIVEGLLYGLYAFAVCVWCRNVGPE